MSRFVYALASDGGPVKIGLSSRPWDRLSTLQLANPSKLAFVFVVEIDPGPTHGFGVATVEERAHALAAEHRISGEWFDLSPDQAAWIILRAAEELSVEVHDVSTKFTPAGRSLSPIAPPSRVPNVTVSFKEARAAVAGYIDASRSAGTRRAYEGGWRDFSGWCELNDLCPVPATPETVAVYVVDLAKRGLAVSTINQRVSAIGHFHRQARHENPTTHSGVMTVLEGIRRTHSRPAAKKQALTADLLAKVVKRIKVKQPRDARDRALLLLAFGAALRRSELCGLQVSDLEWHRRGLLVRLGRTKTDQTGEGRSVAIPEGKLKVAEAVRAWLDASGIVDGPLFRGFDHGVMMPTPLSDGQFARIVKARCEAAGLDPASFGGHSLRRGFASSAGDDGADIRHIARHLRHSKLETTAGYIEDADLFRQHAGKGFM